MRRAPLLPAVLIAALGIPLLGMGEDPPPAGAPPFDPAAARRLAESFLDSARGDASREKYEIVWPEGEPKPPAPGDEVVLIGGYISNYLVVLRWTGEGVEASRLSMARSWFYNREGESFAPASLSLSSTSFATRWAAARLIVGTRSRRRGPEPDFPAEGTFSGGYFSGSHTPEQWVRIRSAGVAAPLFLANQRGQGFDWEHVPYFEEVRAQVLFDLFHEPVLLATRRRGAIPAEERPALETWRPFLRRELRSCIETKDGIPGRPGFLLLEVCLRGISMAGDESDLELVHRVDAMLGTMNQEDYGTRSARQEAGLARLRLELRWKFAAEVIRSNPRERHAQNDLSKWARDHFRRKDPNAYRDLLLADLRTGTKDRDLLLETIPEVARCLPGEAAGLLGPLRGGGDAEVEAAIDRALAPKTLPAESGGTK